MKRILLTVWVVVTLGVAMGTPVRSSQGGFVSGDEPQYLMTAISLFEDADLDISDELSEQRYRGFHAAPLPVQTEALDEGRAISPHDPFLPLLLTVPVTLYGWMGARLLLASMAGVTAVLMVWLAIERFTVPTTSAVIGVIGFVLAPPLAVYGTQIYPEISAALAVTVGLIALTGRLRSAGLVLLGSTITLLPWLSIKYVPIAIALTGLGAWRLMRSRRFAALTLISGALAVAGLLYVLAHWTLYGGFTPYATGDHFVGAEWTVMGDVDLWSRLPRSIGLLVDGRFGLAAWQPGYLLVLPALGFLVGRAEPHRAVLAIPALAGWLTATFLAVTMHGWWFPGRHVVAILPCLVLAIVVWVDRVGVERLLMVSAGVGILTFAWIIAEGWAGSLTWAADPFATSNPLSSVVAEVLPDYARPGPLTWATHLGWVALSLLLAYLGWRVPDWKQHHLPFVELKGDTR